MKPGRRSVRRFLAAGRSASPNRRTAQRRLRFEPLESRQLLAADCEIWPMLTATSGAAAAATQQVGAYDTMSAAYNIGNLTTFSASGSISSTNTRDYYVFSLTAKSTVNLSLTGLSADSDVELLQDLNGDKARQSSEVIARSINGGSASEAISKTLEAGTYFVRVYRYQGNTSYRLNLSAQTVTPNQAPTVAQAAQANPGVVTGKTVALSVLGADDAGESKLTYTWTAVGPTGAAAPTFSANGTNAAKSTTATFSKIGVYTFTATIKDAGGLTATSTVQVTVNATLTSIVVTPATLNLNAGATQQFAASARDQFGDAMAAQPAFAWTTTIGSISTGGLLTAPAAAGTGTVTAKSGTISGTAGVTVGGGTNFLGLKDKGLADLTQSLDADGSISRNDMIQILRAAGSDDLVVDANEFADLKTILSQAATLNIAGYVQVLAGDVINGNLANAYYQGTTLGNLAAGSTATQLNKLVDKWFVGADHPAAGSYTYRTAAGALFVGGPGYADMRQGALGDCYLIASLGAIAQSTPAAIQNMFIDNGDNTWTVRFYYNGVADYVTVDRLLPTNASGQLVYSNSGSLASSTGNELWMPLAEKAYAQWNETGKEGRDGKNAYASIEGGWMATVDAQVLGRAAASYNLVSSSDNQALIQGLTSNKAVTIGTKGSPGNGLYGNHAYAVLGYDSATATFRLYNPWGSNQPGLLTWAQLQQSCSAFVVADASGTQPIRTVAAPRLIAGLPQAWTQSSESLAAAWTPVARPSSTASAAPAASVAPAARTAGDQLAAIRVRSTARDQQATDRWFSELGADETDAARAWTPRAAEAPADNFTPLALLG
jgi:hypothetical protein